jgi:predicted O-methyltransferase YrrM
MKALRARRGPPDIAKVDRRVAKLDRRLTRLDKRFKSRVRKSVRKELEAARKKDRGEDNWTYDAGGMATVHFSPFLEDPIFTALYEEMVADWFPGKRIEARWRIWLLVKFVRQCEHLGATAAEFGTYRGGVAFMLLGMTDIERLYLFDTFAGIPEDNLTDYEVQRKFGGHLSDTSPEYVEQLLTRWAPRFELCPGDVFATLTQTETGPLSFVHMDLNAAAPTGFALEYAYPRLVTGGMMVFDDYGWHKYRDQRTVVDDFFSQHLDEVIALPTGQGLVVKNSSVGLN